MRKVFHENAEAITKKAKDGKRYIILVITADMGTSILNILDKPYQTSDRFEAHTQASVRQEKSTDTLCVAEINTYLGFSKYVSIQNIFDVKPLCDIKDQFRWRQLEGFDYCIIEPTTGEIACDSMTELPLYMTKEKALMWGSKGYTPCKVSRYLANGKPIIMENLS